MSLVRSARAATPAPPRPGRCCAAGPVDQQAADDRANGCAEFRDRPRMFKIIFCALLLVATRSDAGALPSRHDAGGDAFLHGGSASGLTNLAGGQQAREDNGRLIDGASPVMSSAHQIPPTCGAAMRFQ